jgi:hypothetical protein
MLPGAPVHIWSNPDWWLGPGWLAAMGLTPGGRKARRTMPNRPEGFAGAHDISAKDAGEIAGPHCLNADVPTTHLEHGCIVQRRLGSGGREEFPNEAEPAQPITGSTRPKAVHQKWRSISYHHAHAYPAGLRAWAIRRST